MWIEDALYAEIKKVMPIPCVDIVVERKSDGRVLLLKRNNEPLKGQWWLPGGRINRGEAVYEAAIRKLEEEAGIKYARLTVGCGAISLVCEGVHTIAVLTYITQIGGYPEIILNGEHSEFYWASKEEALNLLGEPARTQYNESLRRKHG